MQESHQDFYTRQETKLLKDFDRVVKHMKAEIASRYGAQQAAEVLRAARQEYQRMLPDLPYVGGRQPFTQFVITSAWWLAVYRGLQGKSSDVRESGEMFFELSRRYMQQVPGLVRRYLGKSMFTKKYQQRLKERALESQQCLLPRGYIFSYIESDGVNFDFGVDYHRCATLNFLREQGAEAIAPYLCALDQFSSEMLGWGLIRTTTLAEGGEVCDFRFKQGGPTRLRSTVLKLG